MTTGTTSDAIEQKNVIGRTIPTWLLALLVALFGWNLHFALPGAGLDVSWWAGLYMATREGMQFGTEIVFTYGPLGFMKQPWLWYGGLGTVSFFYTASIFIAFLWALLWILRPLLGAVLACIVATLMVLQLPGIDFAIGLAVLWSFGMLVRRPNGHAFTIFYVGGAVFVGAEALMKLSSGPVIFAVLLAGLIGARARLWQIAAFIGIYAGSTLTFWLIAGQSLGNIPDYLVNSIQILAGYTEAMSTYESSLWLVPVMILALAATVAWAWLGQYPDRWAKYAATAIVIVVGAAMYKQGVVRMDGGHRAIFFAMIAVCWVAVPPGFFGKAGLLTGAIVLGSLSVYAFGPNAGAGINPIQNVDGAVSDAKDFLGSARKQKLIDERREVMQLYYGLDPEMLGQLAGRTVSTDPSEVAAAWAYELDWSPLPVFQNYSAYTPELDDLNADVIASPSGPERILRSAASVDPPGSGIDFRFVGWDPPRQAIATLCNFAPISTKPPWQVLARVKERCDGPVPAGSVEGQFDQVVEVPAPAPDEVVYASIEGAGVSGLESIRSLLYRPKVRYAITSSGSRYRLIGALAGQGLMLRSGRLVGRSGPEFEQIPQTDTIELTGASGDLAFHFYRMKVRPVGARLLPSKRPRQNRDSKARRAGRDRLTGVQQ